MDATQNQILGCIQISGENQNIRSEKCKEHEFSEVGLPGVEIDPTPHGIILHPFPASQLPYMAKSDFVLDFLGGGSPL